MDFSTSEWILLGAGAVIGLFTGLFVAAFLSIKLRSRIAVLEAELKTQARLDEEREQSMQLAAERLSQAFGTQCVVLAIDARRLGDSWDTLVVGGREATGIDAIEWAREGTRLGAGEILLTSWDRDGTRAGCDVELLETMREAVDVPVIASGGVGTPEDVVTAFRAGADAVLAASVFHDGDLTVGQIKTYVSEQGLAIRP